MSNGLFTYDIEKQKKGYTVVSLFYTPANTKQQPISIKVAPELGSNMFSFIYGKHLIIYTNQKILEQAGFTGTYVLFPTPNRVKNFTYTWQGNTYILQKNGKTVDTHHQLVFDQPFIFEKPILFSDHIALITHISIDQHSHLFPGFPFPCSLALEYNLYPNRVHIQYTVANLGHTEMPFGFGLHPHFRRLSGDDKTLITIPARSVMETMGDTLLPNGKLINVRRTSADVLNPTPVGILNLDHVFTDIIKGKHAEVDYSSLGFKISLQTSPEFTHIVCWSGHPKAICIENQTCSTNALNLRARGFVKESNVLQISPGASHHGYISYDIVHS